MSEATGCPVAPEQNSGGRKLFALHAERWGMKDVELYAEVRYAIRIEGISGREAARRFGIDPRTVAKTLSFSLPPGYRRSRPLVRPKLDPFVGIIERILEEDSLQDGATADALRTICDLDLTDLKAIDEP